MNPDQLFLARCEQIESIVNAEVDPLAVLDLARIIRQMFFDDHSLADVVNKSRLKLKFVTSRSNFKIFEPAPAPAYGPHDRPIYWPTPPMFESMLGDIDAIGSNVPEYDRVELTANQFGQHPIGRIEGVPYTVKKVIQFAANKKGGVHYDLKRSSPEFAMLQKIDVGEVFNSRVIGMWNAEILLMGKVYLRGLAPLIVDVQARHAQV